MVTTAEKVRAQSETNVLVGELGRSAVEEISGELRDQVCQDFCVNGQVLFLGWGAGEGCPFPCPSM